MKKIFKSITTTRLQNFLLRIMYDVNLKRKGKIFCYPFMKDTEPRRIGIKPSSKSQQQETLNMVGSSC